MSGPRVTADDLAGLCPQCGTKQRVLLDEIDRLREFRAEYHRFTSSLGYGDGVTEPAATPSDLLDPLSAALSVAGDHDECCPEWCDDCYQWEKPRSCERCCGSGYGGPLRQSIENVQGWSDCNDCGGDGRRHESYNPTGEPTAAERDLAAAQTHLAAVRALMQDAVNEHQPHAIAPFVFVDELRAALAEGPAPETPK